MTDTLREQMARIIDPKAWRRDSNDWEMQLALDNVRQQSLERADAAIAVAEPIIRADERERLAQEILTAHPNDIIAFSPDIIAAWLRAQDGTATHE